MSPCADAQVFDTLRSVPVPESLIDEAARRFALLSDPTRLRLLSVLLEREPVTVGELSEALGIATPNVSQHLARLSAGRLVSREKLGRTVQYRTTDPNLRQLCELMCTSLVAEARRLHRGLRAEAPQPHLGLRAEGARARAG
jgi:DNA-binding transcriptional ArsR family regulator